MTRFVSNAQLYIWLFFLYLKKKRNLILFVVDKCIVWIADILRPVLGEFVEFAYKDIYGVSHVGIKRMETKCQPNLWFVSCITLQDPNSLKNNYQFNEDHIMFYLTHEHEWIRLASSQLFGMLFSSAASIETLINDKTSFFNCSETPIHMKVIWVVHFYYFILLSFKFTKKLNTWSLKKNLPPVKNEKPRYTSTGSRPVFICTILLKLWNDSINSTFRYSFCFEMIYTKRLGYVFSRQCVLKELLCQIASFESEQFLSI